MDPAHSRYCPACRSVVGGEFQPGPGGRPDASCPRCHSLERERFLALLLDMVSPALHGTDVLLDVAPSARTSPLLATLRPRRTVRVDLDPAADGRSVDVRASLTGLPLADMSVDLLFCYHVLEHVPDDRAAMREMRRVLAPRGLGIVQVPYRAGRPTDEDPDAPVEERIARFGQADHVRYYGHDFDARLSGAGLEVQRVTVEDVVGPATCTWMRLTPQESVWFVRPGTGEDGQTSSALGSGALAAALGALHERLASAEHALAEQGERHAPAPAGAAVRGAGGEQVARAPGWRRYSPRRVAAGVRRRVGRP